MTIAAAPAYRGVAGHAPIALWAVPVAELGGVARHVLDVARVGLPRTRLVVLCPPGPLADALRAQGTPVLAEPFGPQAGLRASVGSLRHAVRTLRPAVLHTHLAWADIAAALAIPVSWPVRLVSTEHGIAAPGHDAVYHASASRRRLMAAVHTARCERFDALIAVSRATADAMRVTWHPRRDIVVIPNGVDVVAARQARKPGLRILSLARLAPEKRIGELLKAFSLLHRDHREARLTVAGTGVEEPALRRSVQALGLGDSVTFPGFLDAAAALASHDVLAQLSVWENCSYSLLDAVAAGLGVVATPVGGNPEILPTRCLVAADDLRGLAAHLEIQGLELSARPSLGSWPSVAQMCARVVDVYRGCFA
ncbi:glycosyltransferase family 4 protein [Actinomyces sp. MRS3W]|uniref:glycosyltransferase family 4 protein n=1 Tax=Actinomyces sp. MRS3W TaxID=2800796 RepID=UPI0028FD5280|nr:glycosyltransferase family 4 protein [Actinomyces sp. MRS3W]MDU0347528.1 glycosyltransferase family 4 protein [Actinomyces sp. MRS3W]